MSYITLYREQILSSQWQGNYGKSLKVSLITPSGAVQQRFESPALVYV